MLIKRKLLKTIQKSKRSILLLGPRQTGKSTLIREMLKPDIMFNMAHEQTFLDFSRNPKELEERLSEHVQINSICIDEVQRLPSLLNTIQVILDEQSNPPQFFLTGSSARKLKRGKANLLPGRIHTYHLGPLASSELSYDISHKRALKLGTLPGIYTDQDESQALKTLKSYTSTYLKEEIQAEALTRNVEGFSRFLFTVASCAGQFLDFEKISKEARISRSSAVRYFEILEDTLIVKRCDAFSKSHRRRLIQHPKFYFFDTGVLNALLGSFQVSQDRIGLLFEHLFFSQLIASAQALDQDIRISTYRTEHGAEVDFICEFSDQVWAIELKATAHIGKINTRGFKSFQEFSKKPCKQVIATLGETEKRINDIQILPWQKLIQLMGL